MSTPRHGLFPSVAAAILVAFLTAPASADVVQNENIEFAGVRMNPWSSDPEFGPKRSGSIFNRSFYLPFPTIEGNPTQAALNGLSDLLGIPLPIRASVGIGGSASGSVGLDWGYEVTGGRLHMNYPAHTTLRVSTKNNGHVQPRVDSTITTTFQPGITQASTITPFAAAVLAGPGYLEEMALDGGAGAGAGGLPGQFFRFNQFTTPTFATEQPNATAYVKAHANLEAGLGVHATGCFIFCVSEHKDFKFGLGAQEWTIVEVDPTKIYTPLLEYDLLNDKEIDLGEVAKLKLSVPKVVVHSDPPAPGSPVLYGTASKPIITVLFDLEKYIPFIGEYLDGSIGPFSYHLLSLDAGPQLNLYQDLTFTPHPKVQLNFSEEVMIRGADDVFRPGRSVTKPLGEPVDWRPVFSPNLTVGIQPTYIMDNTFRNETGFEVGVEFELKTLEVETPVGDLGPLCCDPVSFTFVTPRVKFYENEFTLPMEPISAASIVLPKDNALGFSNPLDTARLTNSILYSRNSIQGTASYLIGGIFSRHNPDGEPLETPFNFRVEGVETSYLPAGAIDPVYFLSTGEDVMQYVGPTLLNLGRDFRLGVDNLINTQWFIPPNPVYVDELTNDELLLADLSTFRLDEVDIDTHPILGFQNEFDHQTVTPPENGPTVTDDLRNGPLVLSHVESYEGVPEGGGGFAAFAAPVINSAGQMAYRADLAYIPGNAADTEGYYLTADDGTVKLLRSGDLAPGGTGLVSLAPGASLTLSDSGQLTTFVNIQSQSGNGIVRTSGAAATSVARVGEPSPNGDGSYFSFGAVAANEAGTAAFLAEVQQPDSGTYFGVFRNDGQAAEVIVRHDQTPAGLDHPIGGFSDPAINASGQVAFLARYGDGSTFGAQGIYRGDGGSLTTIAVARITSPQPGEFHTLFRPSLNNAGQVAFRALRPFGDGTGIYRGDGTQTVAVAQSGTAAPGTAGTFLGFYDPHINDLGQVAFAALTFNGASYNSGIFRSDGGTLTAIAVSNQSPDNANGIFDYGSFYESSGDRDFAFNNHGHVAFVGNLNLENGSVGGLFLHDGTYLLEIARTGQSFQGSTIQGIFLATGSDTEDGLNDSMQIAYTVALADGRQAVARFEPVMLWKNSGSGSWDTDSNWSLGVQPTRPYDVAIIREDAMTVAGPATPRFVRSVIVGGYGESLNTLRLEEGGDVTASQRVALAANGELVLGSGRTLTTPVFENAGIVRGWGTILGDVQNDGVVAPGGTPGVLFVDGDYAQSGAGTLAIEVASPSSYDQLVVRNEITLGGTIAVSLVGGFLPTLGQSFTIVDSLTDLASGTFASTNFPIFSGRTFDVVYNASGARLQVVPGLPGDYNNNGTVDTADYAVWRLFVGSTTNRAADGTGPGGAPDGVVDQLDYVFWRAHFGQTRIAPGMPGDFNNSGTVDVADYVVWRRGLGTTYTQADYGVWRAHFGQTGGGSVGLLSPSVPEPSTAVLAIVAGLVILARSRRSGRHSALFTLKTRNLLR